MAVNKTGREAPRLADPKFASYLGKVINRNDPMNLGRVKFSVPGLIDQSTWAHPIGTFGSASQQGISWVPELDAFVVVLFHQGDINHPFYLPGPWACPGGVNEMPSETQASVDVKTIKTKNFKIVFDDRTGAEELIIEDLTTGNILKLKTIDSSTLFESFGDMDVKAKTNLTLESDTADVDIKAPTDITVDSLGTMLLKAITTLTMQAVSAANQILLDATGVKITGPTILLTGATTMTGIFTLNALMTSTSLPLLMGSGAPTRKPVLDGIIANINAATYGGNAIDTPVAAVNGTNVSADIRMS